MGKIGDLWVRLGLKKDDYERGLDSATRSTKSFSGNVAKHLEGVITKFMGVAAAVKVLGQTVKTLASFQRANSTLASVLGTTVDKITELTESAKQLGRTTEFTASNVTELQTALARLGFNQNQIGSMQESILKFASAVGTDLASAADFTGSALRAFGLQATDTGALLDVMAASTSKSALDFSKLQTSISIVAPIAKSFGLTADQTASFLGVLANNGFDASSAATALRNILLNLADSNGKLAQGIGHSAKTFDEIIDAFTELESKGVDVNSVLQMTDKRSASAASALIANGKAVKELNVQLTNCTGSLNDMYDTMTNNLAGATRNLKSAWEGLMLSFSEGTGPMKSVVDWMTKMVNKITDFNNAVQTGGKSAKSKSGENELLDRFMAIGRDQGKEEMQRQYDQWVRDANAAYDRALDAYVDHKTRANKKAMMEAGEVVMNLADISSQIQNFGNETPTPTETPTETPTITPSFSIPGDDKKNTERDRAEKIQKRAQDSAKSEIQLLQDKYSEEKKLLEQFGIDTTALTKEYYKNLESTISEEADEALKHLGEYEPVEIVPFEFDDDVAEQFLEKMEQSIQRAQDLVDDFSGSVVAGFTDACQEMMDQLFGLSEVNLGAVVSAMLTPLADMAIRAGEIIMAEGVATKLANEALKNFGESGAAAAAAGAALIAAGTAAKAGLSALASRGSASTATTSYGSSASGTAPTVEAMELTVHVDGRIQGSDIVLSGSNTTNEWGK